MQTQTLYNSDTFRVTKSESEEKVFIKKDYVVIFPYTVTNMGVVDLIGVMKNDKNEYSCIYGEAESNPLDSAKDIFTEITNKKQDDNEKWDYVGCLKQNSLVEYNFDCFLVDVTDSFDSGNFQTKKEKLESDTFQLAELSKLTLTEDVILSSAIMKFFIKKHSGAFSKL